MKKHSRFIVLCSSLFAVFILTVLCCVSCTEEKPKPSMFPLDEPIPLGPYSLTVLRAEDMRNVEDHPIGQGVAVFFVWDGFRPEGDYESFLRAFTSKRLVVLDSKGNRYKPATRMIPASLYYMADVGGKIWVVMFEVPKGSSGLTLIIENPEVREKQPRIAAVNLGL